MTAMFVNTGVIATTFVRIDAEGLRMIEVDEKPAKKLPKEPPFDLQAIAPHSQRDVLVPLDQIAKVQGGLGSGLDVVTTSGKRHFLSFREERKADALAAFEAALGCERQMEQATLGEALVAPIVYMILSGIGGGILYGIAASGATQGDVRPGRHAGAKALLAAIGDALGPTGALGLTALVLAALGAWLALRVVRRPLVPVLVPSAAREPARS